MIAERIERYDLGQTVDGVVIRMRQGRRALSVGLISLAVVVVSWWFGPYGPRPTGNWARAGLFYWMWSGFFSLICLVSLAGAFYREDWTITDRAIAVTRSLGPWRRTRRVSRSATLGIRVEVIPGVSERPIFPYRLHFLTADRNDSDLSIELQQAPSVDRFLQALRTVLNLDVADPRLRRE